MAGGRISGGPGGPTPCHGAARLGSRHHVVWGHGGSPRLLQVPLCPILDVKI
jgi:hypothetical protein